MWIIHSLVRVKNPLFAKTGHTFCAWVWAVGKKDGPQPCSGARLSDPNILALPQDLMRGARNRWPSPGRRSSVLWITYLVSQGRGLQNKLLTDFKSLHPLKMCFPVSRDRIDRETRERRPCSSCLPWTALVEGHWPPRGILASVLLLAPVAPVPWIYVFN